MPSAEYLALEAFRGGRDKFIVEVEKAVTEAVRQGGY